MKNRVLIISSAKFSSGAEFVLYDFLKNNIKTNEYFLLTGQKDGIFDEFINNISFEYLLGEDRVNKVGKLFMFLASIIKIISVIFKKNIKLGIGNNTIDMIYSFIFKITGKNYILMIHDIIIKESFRGKSIRVFDKFISEYIAVSNAVKIQLVNLGIDEKKIRVIYNGLQSDNKIMGKNRNDTLNFAFVGGIDDRKNPQLFLDIIKEFKKKNELRSYLVYHYKDQSLFDEIYERNKEESLNVEFINAIPREKINEFLRNMDFVIITSKNDPLPTVVLEAMRMGTPIIGINKDGIPEMINDRVNGFLFQTIEDIERIREELENLDYKRMSDNCIETIKNKFNIQSKQNELNFVISSYQDRR